MLTNHAQGEQGVNILKEKYDVMANAILDSLVDKEEMSLKEVFENVHRKLMGRFEGSISWYFTTVKLDLEARGIIERVPGASPQRIRLSR